MNSLGRTTGDKIKSFLMFALPGTFVFLCVVILPFLYGFYLTFTDWNGVASVKNLVGFSNYSEVFRDKEFWKSMGLTLKYVVLSVLLVNAVGFLFAYFLSGKIKRGQNLFRAGFFTPNLIGGVVLGFIWQFVFSQVLVKFGKGAGIVFLSKSWLSDPTKAFWALVIVSVWQLSGYMMLIYIAGFTDVFEFLVQDFDFIRHESFLHMFLFTKGRTLWRPSLLRQNLMISF